jgi:hypothetical protein
MKKLQEPRKDHEAAGQEFSSDSTGGAASIYQQKEDVIYIRNPDPRWKYLSLLNIGKHRQALTIALQKDKAIALLLNKHL